MRSRALAVAAFGMLIAAGCTSRMPLTATSNALGAKSGESCQYLLFHSIPLTGDNDIASAARQGDIKLISVVDRKFTNYLVYSKQCTVVYGE